MSANNQKLSFKDKITSHLPGHKNQDNNMNGVPDRLEKNTAATTGHRTLSDKNGNGIPDRLERNGSFGQTAPFAATPLGSTVIPGSTERIITTTTTSNRDGLPIAGNVLRDEVVTQQNVITEPAMLQTQPLMAPALPLAQDLNRNGIPDNLERGNSFGFIGSTQTNTQSFVDVREAPVIVEKIEKPAVIHEVLKTEEVVQIQPVIERQREKLDVYEVVQPMREREVIATEVRSAVLPAQTRAVVVEDNSAFLAQRSAPTDFSTREVAATMTQTIQNAPIIHETIVHKVIEEVQPVIYKEIDRPILIKETLPIYEKIVEAPHAHHTVLPIRDLGVRSVTTGVYTDLNRDGIPDQLQQGMSYQTTGLQSGLQSQGTFAPGLQGQQFATGYNQTGFQTLPGQGLTAGDKLASHLPGHQFQDRNGNGIPDRMEGRNQDLNRDGIPDRLQGGQYSGLQGQQFAQPGFSSGLAQPGFSSGLAQPGFSQSGYTDLNRDGIPDQLQGSTGLNQGQFSGLNQGRRTLSDLNGNGIPDRMEKAHGLKDLNGNGIDDSLERKMRNTNLNSQTF